MAFARARVRDQLTAPSSDDTWCATISVAEIVGTGKTETMARIKVGSGFGKVTFETAIQRSSPGDLLILDPGRYEAEPTLLRGLGLHGNGTADQVEVSGSFTVKGHCTFTNLTFRALPYHNAISVKSVDSMATVMSCIFYGDPGAKYPTIWCEAGTLVLNQFFSQPDPEQHAMYVTGNGKLHATSSQLGSVAIDAAKADLIDSTTNLLQVSDGGRVNTFGAHRFASFPGKRAFVVSDQSVCNFPQLLLEADYVEGFAQDSIIQIENIMQEPGGSFTVEIKDGARVTTLSSAVRVVDQDAPPVQTGPKSIPWPLQYAHEFDAKILPQLNSGDTIILETGDYFLDHDSVRLMAANFTGQGQGATRLHGSIGAMASSEATLKHLTVCAPDASRNAIYADQSNARLVLEDVQLRSAPQSQASTVYASAGTVIINESAVVSQADMPEGAGQIVVVGDARFEAQRSNLGWFYTDRGARSSLSHCCSYRLSSESGAALDVVDDHRLFSNECDQYSLFVGSGAKLTVQSLELPTGDIYLRIDGGALVIPHFDPPMDGTLIVHKANGDVSGISSEAYDLYELNENDEPVLVHEASWGMTAQHSQDQDAFGHPRRDATDGHPNDPALNAKGEPDALDIGSSNHLAELNALVGLSKVKKQVQGFVNVVKLRQKRAALGLPADDEFTLHSMFLGNPGTGKTSVARLIGKAMYGAGVVENDTFVEAGRAQLVSDNIGGTAKQTRTVLESGRGGVVFIDEAYALASEDSAGFAEEAVTEILTFMENHRADTMVILAGYNDKMHELLAVNDGLRSRIKHRFDFEDYSPAEIAEIGLGELARGEYVVNEKLYSRVIGTAYTQSADRSNARWVRNFNQDLRAKQSERVILIDEPTREDLATILDEDLHALVGGGPDSRETRLAEKLAELDRMIGLAPVKEWVRSLVDQATVNQHMIEFDGAAERPNYHVAFTGNPGTGKTTVARIIAEIFHALGILATPTVTSVAASKLVGKYLGHSADNTHKAFDAAMGGVLFVDEAHQLRAGEGSNGALKQEVIDAMITRLEDDRDKFVAVFAGYTDQMHEFFASDPGLKSRIPAEIEFPDYTAAEVAKITAEVLAQKWSFDKPLLTEIAEALYESLPEPDQSNGRWARTFAEAVVSRHNRYLIEHNVRGEEMKHIPDDVLREFAL